MRPALPLLALAFLVCLSPAATAQSEFTATFESDAITLDEDSRNVTLSVTGRTGTNVTVTSPDLNDSTVAELFDGQQTTDGAQVFVPEDGTLTVTFPARFECLPGKYRFTLRDGEATTNASITVFESGESKAAFTDSVTRVRPGGLAEIGIAVDRCSDVQRLRVAIRSNATEFRANVTVAPNGSGDVRGSLLFDTGNVSADGFAADGNLSLVEAAVAAPPENGTLPAGEYDLTLSAHGDETDVATLVVESAPQTPTATPTSRPATRTDTVVSTTGAPTRSPDETVTPTRTPLGTTQSPTSVPTPPPSPTATPSPTEAVTTTVPSFDPPGSGLVPAAIVVGFVVVVALLGAVALLGLRL